MYALRITSCVDFTRNQFALRFSTSNSHAGWGHVATRVTIPIYWLLRPLIFPSKPPQIASLQQWHSPVAEWTPCYNLFAVLSTALRVKGINVSKHSMKTYEGNAATASLILNLCSRRDGMSPTVETGWSKNHSAHFGEIFDPAGIRTPDRPTHSIVITLTVLFRLALSCSTVKYKIINFSLLQNCCFSRMYACLTLPLVPKCVCVRVYLTRGISSQKTTRLGEDLSDRSSTVLQQHEFNQTAVWAVRICFTAAVRLYAGARKIPCALACIT